MNQTVITALFVGATSGCLAGLWMGSQPPRDRDPDYRRSFNHENTGKPSGPPHLRWRCSESDEQRIRMDEGRVQRSMGNNPTTPKPVIVPRPQIASSGVIRVEGTFEHGGRTYRYEADAKPL